MGKPESRKEIEQQLLNDPFIVAEWYRKPEDRDVCESCISALEDPEDIVREAAVSALIALNDMYASTPIVHTLLHGSALAREAAAKVLGFIGTGDPIAFQYLAAALSDSEKRVRVAAIHAIQQLSANLDLIAEAIERS